LRILSIRKCGNSQFRQDFLKFSGVETGNLRQNMPEARAGRTPVADCGQFLNELFFARRLARRRR
jgi:hypothetical protein